MPYLLALQPAQINRCTVVDTAAWCRVPPREAICSIWRRGEVLQYSLTLVEAGISVRCGRTGAKKRLELTLGG